MVLDKYSQTILITFIKMKFLRFLLFPFSVIYGIVVAIRNKLYDIGFLGSTTFQLPIISIGNLSTGGTGKTPLVEYIIRLLSENNSLAVLSRGYKRTTYGFVLANEAPNPKDIGDEPALLKWKFPHIEMAVGEERIMAIPLLISSKPDIDIILLDDAFQHRPLRPWISILTTTYTKPFWNDYLLPMGRLRESIKGVKRANIIIITNCPPNLIQSEKKAIKKKCTKVDNQVVVFSKVEYGTPFLLTNSSQKIRLNKDMNVLLFAGIGEPEHLKAYVSSQVKTLNWLGFDDHYWYDKSDVFDIERRAKEIGEQVIILTTEKDAIRFYEHISTLKKENISIYVLPMEMVFLDNDKPLFDCLIIESLSYFA